LIANSNAHSVKVRILIVDDSALLRQQLRRLLQQNPHWEVCGESEDGREAVQKTRELNPDLIVMDFAMPQMNGVEAAREITKSSPELPILMFTMYMSNQLVDEAKGSGIRGAVDKNEAGKVVKGIEALLRGESFFDGAGASTK
jgi:DNA-binding NarL/FixJ family response regulator